MPYAAPCGAYFRRRERRWSDDAGSSALAASVAVVMVQQADAESAALANFGREPDAPHRASLEHSACGATERRSERAQRRCVALSLFMSSTEQ